MAKKLKDLVITKVALVPKGSNPESDITMFKSAEPVTKITFEEVIAGHPEGVRQALWKIYELTYALNNTVYANMAGGKNVVRDVEKSLDQFVAACKEVLADSSLSKATKESADALQAAVLTNAREFLAKHQEGTVAASAPATKKREDMTKEELLAELDRVEKAKTAPPTAPAAATPTVEDITKEHKDLPPNVVSFMKAQDERLAKIEADNKRNEELAKEERLARRTTEMIAFVNKELKHLPGKPEDLAKSLINMQDTMTKESYEVALAGMKAGNAALEKTGEESGEDEAQTANGSAYQKLQGIAKQFQEKDSKLTDEAAFEKAVDANPDLYLEHRRASRRRQSDDTE